MKKFCAFLLLFCLVFGCAATALAAKPVITHQPETQTVKAGGTCDFSVKVKDIKGLTWYFTNPASGESYTGKTLAKAVKGLKVINPNKSTVTLKKVPEEMHGWSVHCKVSANGYTLESDTVLLLIEGLPVPGSETAVPAEESATPEPISDTAEVSAEQSADEPVVENEDLPDENTVTEPTEEPVAEPISDPVAEPMEPVMITVTAEGALLQEAGTTEEPAVSLTLPSPASVKVIADSKTKKWVINGVTVTTDSKISGFTLKNVTENMTVVANVPPTEKAEPTPEVPDSAEPTAEPTPEPVLDYNNLCTVTCENCYFSGGEFNRETAGSVPAGTLIRVTAGRKGDLTAGYSINGGAYEHANEASFELTVNESVTIVMP